MKPAQDRYREGDSSPLEGCRWLSDPLGGVCGSCPESELSAAAEQI